MYKEEMLLKFLRKFSFNDQLLWFLIQACFNASCWRVGCFILTLRLIKLCNQITIS
jgi:hypothetical protein